MFWAVGTVRRLSVWRAVLAGAVTLLAGASPAAASVTIGQVGNPDPGGSCSAGFDWVQPTVTSGNPFVVPAAGGIASWTVTSWTTFGGPDPNEQMTMKIFRAVPGQAATYQAVGRAGPQVVTPAGTAGNTFPANLQVKAGDMLGLHSTTPDWCLFTASGEENLFYDGDLADNQSAVFDPFSFDLRLNIQAVLTPTSAFTIAGTQRNKKKGTATLTFDLPNPGDLAGSGKGAKVATAGALTSKAVAAGTATLLVKAKGKKKRKLNDNGKVKLNLTVTYTPTGGDPNSQPIKLKLKKKL
jgi:hypothetical protein